MTTDTTKVPILQFYRVAPEAPRPMRADRAALGALPATAFQYCEAVTSASAYGWYMFPPLDFHVQWDGTDFLWTYGDVDTWFPVRSEHLPGLPELFDAIAPEDIRGFAPPLLTRLREPGILQIWTGFLVRTRPEWSVLVRQPANLPRSHAYEPYEGIIEADRSFQPLFANLRVTTADRPIIFDSTLPLIQVQPLHRETYKEEHLRSVTVTEGLKDFTETDWADYRHSVVARGGRESLLRPGRYAAAVRKRVQDGNKPGDDGE